MEMIFPPHFNIFSKLVYPSKQPFQVFSKINGLGYQKALEVKVSPQRKLFFWITNQERNYKMRQKIPATMHVNFKH